MTSSRNEADLMDALPDETVASYLENHPDFFIRHPELSERIRIPHECGDAVSLLNYQVERLRERNRWLERRLHELVQVARENDRLAERLHRLTLDLMDSGDLDSVLHTLKEGLRGNFDADMVAVRLFDSGRLRDSHEEFIATGDAALAHFRRFIEDERPVCGNLPSEQADLLFGDSARKVASAALIPVADQRIMGLLAIGSYVRDRFHPSQGTVFLRQLGQVAGRALRPHLDRS